MVILVSSNTYAALQKARTRGIVTRDFVWLRARHRETGALETTGICSEAVAVTVDVIRPDTGAVVSRTYQPGAGLMSIPPIPATLKLEERRLRLTFSRLSPAIINAVRAYDVKGQPVQIHRALYDPDSMRQVDPAHCRFDGFVLSARIRRPKVGNEGVIVVEITDHSASLKANPIKISREFFRERDGDRGGDYVDAYMRTVWGQEVKVRERRRQPRVKLWRS